MYAHGCSTSSSSSSSIVSGYRCVRLGTGTCPGCASRRPGAGSSEFRGSCRQVLGRPSSLLPVAQVLGRPHGEERALAHGHPKKHAQNNSHTLVSLIRRGPCHSNFATERSSRSERRVFACALRMVFALPILAFTVFLVFVRFGRVPAPICTPCMASSSCPTQSDCQQNAGTLDHRCSCPCDHKLLRRALDAY